MTSDSQIDGQVVTNVTYTRTAQARSLIGFECTPDIVSDVFECSQSYFDYLCSISKFQVTCFNFAFSVNLF